MNLITYAGQQIAPSKIICVGRNYVEHIKELRNEMPEQMVVFAKPNSAIAEAPEASGPDPVHYEGEICFLCMAGKLAAVGLGLDLTKRTLQDDLRLKGLPWERSKAFDGSAVFSPFVNYDAQKQKIQLELEINGKLVQSADSTMMIYSPDEILCEVSTFMTLNDGDIIMTGTPAGVGPLNPGDKLAGRLLQKQEALVTCSWTAL